MIALQLQSTLKGSLSRMPFFNQRILGAFLTSLVLMATADQRCDSATFKPIDPLYFEYLNHRGEFEIKPQFANAGDFSGGYATVNLESGCAPPTATIDRTGQILSTSTASPPIAQTGRPLLRGHVINQAAGANGQQRPLEEETSSSKEGSPLSRFLSHIAENGSPPKPSGFREYPKGWIEVKDESAVQFSEGLAYINVGVAGYQRFRGFINESTFLSADAPG